jgi:hypothetical protein
LGDCLSDLEHRKVQLVYFVCFPEPSSQISQSGTEISSRLTVESSGFITSLGGPASEASPGRAAASNVRVGPARDFLAKIK